MTEHSALMSLHRVEAERTAMNPKVQQVQELRRSGAAGKHGDRRLKRLRARGAQKRAALREQVA